MLPNNALERTVVFRGRTVRTFARDRRRCAEVAVWPLN